MLSKNGITLGSVLPVKGVIEELGNLYLPSTINLPEDNLALLIDTFNIHPTSIEWISVTNNLITWANKPNRELGNDLAYLLMLHLFNYNNNDVINLAGAFALFFHTSKNKRISVKRYSRLSTC